MAKTKIDVVMDQEIHMILNMIRRQNISDKDVCEHVGMTRATLRNWRKGPAHGGTRYPANWRIKRAAEAAGFVRIYVPAGTQSLRDAEPFDDSTPLPAPKSIKKKLKVKRGKNVVDFRKYKPSRAA